MPDRRLLILTRRRENASFRQRIAPYLLALERRGIGCQVHELSRAWLRRSRQLFKGRRFDGVWLHRKTLTAWDSLCLPRSCRVIYDFDDAIMFQARAAEAGPHPGRMRRFRRTMRRCDLVLAGNALLADYAREAGAARVAVVPTGLDLRRYPPKTDYAAPDGVRMVWIGSKSTLKQVDRLRGALEAVAKACPGITLRIIADAGLEIPGLHVEDLAWTRDGEAAMLAECDIGIAPMPDTPFTRGKCGFKVLQYMAAGLPVVTSPVGVNAEYVTPDQTGLWAEGSQAWVAAITRLAADEAEREDMGQAGRRRAEAEFDFSVLRETICDAIGEALQ